ncbi:hypothetical protein [Dysgonomonas sp. 520]|uniref:hypothetical protein n=1 Tax=Dysgonomonas sp. 520 TaxID=2302931 RepID=UPI0013D716E5|nr:hypothetical protein [Dysgonomonas sp. 520]NDW09333.1 hypothetical protein [Dysgonomonas sp. 520]
MSTKANKNQVSEKNSINVSNNSKMTESILKLNIDFNEVKETVKVEEIKISNQPALERFAKLAQSGYYFFLQPRTNKQGKSYFWVKATKQGTDRIEFSLQVNDGILNVIVAVLRGKSADISAINANDLESFNKQMTNFEYVLFINEKSQGKTMNMTYTTNGQMFSSYYKRGVIIYKPYLNPELKAYVNA